MAAALGPPLELRAQLTQFPKLSKASFARVSRRFPPGRPGRQIIAFTSHERSMANFLQDAAQAVATGTGRNDALASCHTFSLLGAPGIATRSKDATRAPGLTTRNKRTLLGAPGY